MRREDGEREEGTKHTGRDGRRKSKDSKHNWNTIKNERNQYDGVIAAIPIAAMSASVQFVELHCTGSPVSLSEISV